MFRVGAFMRMEGELPKLQRFLSPTPGGQAFISIGGTKKDDGTGLHCVDAEMWEHFGREFQAECQALAADIRRRDAQTRKRA